MKKLKAGDQIVIYGRRWFDKLYGNTYHSVIVYVNGEIAGKLDFDYGYGEMYRQNAFELLKKQYILPVKSDYITSTDLKDKGIILTCEVTDVQRKKDLKFY